MNNIIEQIEERALAAQAPKTPCQRCGKPISGRGKRMHDLFCYPSKKMFSSFQGQEEKKKTRNSSRSPTLKSFAPSSLISWTFSTYAWALDYTFT
jgi:hypothetical protein